MGWKVTCWDREQSVSPGSCLQSFSTTLHPLKTHVVEICRKEKGSQVPYYYWEPTGLYLSFQSLYLGYFISLLNAVVSGLGNPLQCMSHLDSYLFTTRSGFSVATKRSLAKKQLSSIKAMHPALIFLPVDAGPYLTSLSIAI